MMTSRIRLALGLSFFMLLSSCKHFGSGASGLNATASESCSADVSDTKCGFYDCYEKTFKCGPQGYPLGYGKVYCDKFQGLCGNTLTSARSRQWVNGTTMCLQKKLSQQTTLFTSCTDVKDFAFNSHPFCYTSGAIQNGGVSFCSLNPFEWNQIRGCVSASDQLSVLGLSQIASTAFRCGSFFAGGFFLGDETGIDANEVPDEQTQALIDSMTPAEREARARAFQEFGLEITREVNQENNKQEIQPL